MTCKRLLLPMAPTRGAPFPFWPLCNAAPNGSNIAAHKKLGHLRRGRVSNATEILTGSCPIAAVVALVVGQARGWEHSYSRSATGSGALSVFY